MYVLSNYGSPFAVITEQGDTKEKIKKAISEDFMVSNILLDPSFRLPDWGENKWIDFIADGDDREIEETISIIKLVIY